MSKLYIIVVVIVLLFSSMWLVFTCVVKRPEPVGIGYQSGRPERESEGKQVLVRIEAIAQ